ncbi:hypothetical protein Vadar_004519 [Vaccinium darrowii]|uniref:Uncharacterized protein n=1 Tax=Vaccinium darrowii TaxID=229202 RepID=A0ACB7Z267_9ERIC|nr:hypothetical protein Vadar_004519 [Vaccinium darrowii]
MAGAFLISAAEGIVERLLSQAKDLISNKINNQINLASSFTEDLEDLSQTLEIIHALLHDADQNRKKTSATMLVWLKNLKAVMCDAEDLLDELAYEALRRKIEILGELKHLHSTNVVPSDLKPCNLLYDANYDLKLSGRNFFYLSCSLNSKQMGGYSEDMIPTVGFNMRKLTKGNVTIKLWDLGGQERFCGMWEWYCRGVSAILYVVDAADRDSVPISQSKLHELLTKPSLSGIPLLVLSNKIAKSEAISKQALMDQLGLESISERYAAT